MKTALSPPPATPLETDVYDVMASDGTALRVWRLGSGPPLLVSSPIGIHPDAWLPLAQSLEGRCSLVVAAARGLWESGLPQDADAVTVHDHSNDLAAVAASLDGGPAAYLGYCAGSFALLDALDRLLPRRPTMVVSALLQRGPSEAIITRLITRTAGRTRARETLLSFVYEFSPAGFRERLRDSLVDDSRLAAFIATVHDLYRHVPDAAHAAHLPIHFVRASGDKDALRNSMTQFLATRGNDADRLSDIEGTHFGFFEDPANLARLIGPWLEEGLAP